MLPLFQLEGVEAMCLQALAQLDVELAHAAQRIADDVAAEARRDHPYTDRTGRLTQSTQAMPPRGEFSNNNLRAVVVAGAPYASYLEGRTELGEAEDGTWDRAYAFLMPAWARSEGKALETVEAAMATALARAGWGT